MRRVSWLLQFYAFGHILLRVAAYEARSGGPESIHVRRARQCQAPMALPVVWAGCAAPACQACGVGAVLGHCRRRVHGVAVVARPAEERVACPGQAQNRTITRAREPKTVSVRFFRYTKLVSFTANCSSGSRLARSIDAHREVMLDTTLIAEFTAWTVLAVLPAHVMMAGTAWLAPAPLIGAVLLSAIYMEDLARSSMLPSSQGFLRCSRSRGLESPIQH